METLTGKLNRGEGTAGKLLNDTALYDRMDRVTRSSGSWPPTSIRARARPGSFCGTSSYMRT